MNLSKNVIAFGVTTGPGDEAALHAGWSAMSTPIPLVTRVSPDGGLVDPLLSFLESNGHCRTPEDMVTVIFPQIVASNMWQKLQQYRISKYLERKLSRHPQIVYMLYPIHLPDAGAMPGHAWRTDLEEDGI